MEKFGKETEKMGNFDVKKAKKSKKVAQKY